MEYQVGKVLPFGPFSTLYDIDVTLLLPLQLEAELDSVEEDVDVSDDPEAGGRGPEARHHQAVEAEAAAQGGGGGGGARHHDRHRVWAYFYIL